MKRLWRRIHAWWAWNGPAWPGASRDKTIEIPGFHLPEKRCINCGERFEILAAELNPKHARPRLLHGCRSCRSKGIYNSIWIEI